MSTHRQPRRLCILTTGLAIAGAEAQVVLLATNLRRRKWDVTVVSMLPPEAHSEKLAAADVPLHCLNMRPGVPSPRAVWRLSQFWRQYRPHVVHCHMVHANLLGRVTRLFSPVPVLISTAHSIIEGPKSRDLAYRLTDPLCDLTTNVSQAGSNRYSTERLAHSGRIIWVPNGLDVGAYAPDLKLRTEVRRRQKWDRHFLWLAVGNLREPKDYPNLLRAFAQVAPKYPQFRLAIAGCGPLENELLTLAAQLGLATRVEFLGKRDDVHGLLQAADAYVISSAWEGTSMALLEASAAALPIVGTAVGGNAEVIEEGRTGYLVPGGDSDALATAMARMASLDSEQRRAMGAAGRSRAEANYGLDRVLNKWENIYQQLLETHDSTPHRSALRLIPFGRR